MLMLKLQRRGKIKQESYRLIVGEKRTKLLGKQLEDLGWYDPHQNKFGFNKERIEYWLKIGAKMSPTVNNVLITAGVIEGKKIAKHKKPKKSGEAKEETKAEKAA